MADNDAEFGGQGRVRDEARTFQERHQGKEGKADDTNTGVLLHQQSLPTPNMFWPLIAFWANENPKTTN